MNNDHSPRYHGMSFCLQEHLRKTLHLFAEEAGDQLHGCCLLTPPFRWKDLLPQEQVDAWLTLQAWLNEGEPVGILPEFSGWEDIRVSTAGRPLILDTPLKNNTTAFRVGKSDDWIVIARHEQHTGAESAAPHGEGENWIVINSNDRPADAGNTTYLNEGVEIQKADSEFYLEHSRHSGCRNLPAPRQFILGFPGVAHWRSRGSRYRAAPSSDEEGVVRVSIRHGCSNRRIFPEPSSLLS